MPLRDSKAFGDGLSWLGEQAQTQFLYRHNSGSTRSLSSSSAFPSYQELSNSSYNSLDFFDKKHTIRHQVVVWSVGTPDVKSHTVTMMFRVTLFWNDRPLVAQPQPPSPDDGDGDNEDDDHDGSVWVMEGRNKAVRRKKKRSHVGGGTYVEEDEEAQTIIDVPPISIINADTFETVGRPDICMLRKKSRLMQFSCMYRAKLLQDKEIMNVSQFPHDSLDLIIKLGILHQPATTMRF